ncbi:hypothetical protein Tco_0909163 [Tanacetum coccineum]|uniref:Uncharacterized protein n=1 Tax=Tanacetum coccineum TaxID=301880 RepID=A0ABQ5CSJ1_9ASTR
MLGVPVGGYSLFDLDEREFDMTVVFRFDQVDSVWSGLLDLNSAGPKLRLKEAEGFIDLFKRAEEKLAYICSERVRLEDLLRKANSDYHDGDDGDGNGDDDGTRDDNARGDSDVNQDDDNADSKVDATTKEVDAMTKEVDATTKEVDSTTKEGDALDAIAEVAEDMRRNNEGTVTLERLVTRHSKASPTHVIILVTSGEQKVLGIRLNMKTLSPGLCIDANVVDCWAEILNYEDRFRKDESLSRYFFLTGCITKSMFDETLSTYEEKWKSFAAEVSTLFKDNVGGLTLSDIDLSVQTLQYKSMTILDNMDSGATYDSKCKQPCDLLKKLFASHLRLYGHEMHSKIERLKTRIPKLK